MEETRERDREKGKEREMGKSKWGRNKDMGELVVRRNRAERQDSVRGRHRGTKESQRRKMPESRGKRKMGRHRDKERHTEMREADGERQEQKTWGERHGKTHRHGKKQEE